MLCGVQARAGSNGDGEDAAPGFADVVIDGGTPGALRVALVVDPLHAETTLRRQTEAATARAPTTTTRSASVSEQNT